MRQQGIGQKGLSTAAIVGIVVAVVVVIVVGVVAVVILLNRAPTGSTTAETSVSDIIQHPGQYMGKQVEVKGTVMLNIGEGYGEFSGANSDSIIILENIPSNCPVDTLCYITGTVTMLNEAGVGSYLAISVTSISLAN